jgi:hypothetical protein
MHLSLKVTNLITIFGISSILVSANISPVFAFNLGNALANLAEKGGVSKKVTGYIRDSLDPDPRNGGRILVRAVSDVGIVGDAESCAAFSDLSSTAGSLVVGYFTGGTAAGISKGLGRAATDKACAEKYGQPNPARVEAAKQTFMNSAPAISPQDREIIMAQIRAGERIAQLQAQSEIEKAKILAKSALEVETTKQRGETQRAIIQSQTLLKMTEMNNKKDLELAYIRLQEVQITQQNETERVRLRSEADALIAKLQAEGRVREAEVVAEALIRAKQAEAEAQKAVSQDAKEAAIRVAEIQYDALQKMTESNNATSIEKARIEAETRRRELRSQNQNTIVDAATRIILALIDRDVKKSEIDAQIQISREKSGIGSNPSPNSDPNLVMLQQWGLTPTNCGGSIVSILIEGKQYCVNPHPDLIVANYQYNRATGRLEPLSSSPNPSPNPQPDWGL